MTEGKKAGGLGRVTTRPTRLYATQTKSPSFFLSFATIVPLLFHFDRTKSFRF